MGPATQRCTPLVATFEPEAGCLETGAIPLGSMVSGTVGATGSRVGCLLTSDLWQPRRYRGSHATARDDLRVSGRLFSRCQTSDYHGCGLDPPQPSRSTDRAFGAGTT